MLHQFLQLPLSRASLRHARRSIVISSIEPSLNAPLERPETIVLTESSLYSNSSWKDAFESFYPKQGIHFSSIDMLRTASDTQIITSVKSLEKTLASDLSHLATIGAAHTVLVARGPVQCLVAQYFLESLPLAGLVLVDPLLLPDDGRVKQQNNVASSSGVVDNRWRSSLKDLMALLDGNAPNMYKHADEIVKDDATHPLLLGDRVSSRTTIPAQISESKSTSLDIELSLLNSLTQNKDSQQLLLEPGIVPMLIFYSNGANNDYEDYYRICAERTAAFHTCAGSSDYFDQVSVAKIPTLQGGSGGDDLDHLLTQIYEWYDVVVA